jgi:hypothetical protein
MLPATSRLLLHAARSLSLKLSAKRRCNMGNKFEDILTQCDTVAGLSTMGYIHRGVPVTVENTPSFEICMTTAEL